MRDECGFHSSQAAFYPARCRNWGMRWIAVVSISCLASVTFRHCAAQEEGATLLQRVIEASRDRESNQCANAFVEWTVSERVQPEALRPAARAPHAPQIPAHELKMTRTHSLVVANRNWRLDSNGEKLVQPSGHAEIGVWPVEDVIVYGENDVRMFSRTIGIDNQGHGQVSRTQRSSQSPWMDDSRVVPVILFARPSDSALFQQVVRGEFQRSSEPDTQDGRLVCLSDKQWNAFKIWLDSERKYIPVRLQFRIGGTLDTQIDYADFEGFGLAPSKWTSARRSTSGEIVEFLSAKVTTWHDRASEIASLVDYRFPAGVKVTDLDGIGPYVAESDRPLLGLAVTVGVLGAVVAALVMVMRQRRRNRMRG